MKAGLIGFLLSFMAIFPLAEFGGGQSLKSWMEEYERFLIRQNAENFRREAEEKQEKKDNERKAGEEIQTEAPDTGSANMDDPDQSIDGGNERVAESVGEDSGPGLPETGTPVAAETTAAAEVPAPAEQVKIYAVNGAVLAEDLQAYLYRRFCEAGIGWFYEYALLIAYQESRFNIYAVNQKNMMDSGLFQFRSIYWAEYCSMAGLPCGDIFDPYLQIDVFTFCMARRLNQFGCSIPDAISRHNQSDWGPYCQSYVDVVMQWESVLVQIQ